MLRPRLFATCTLLATVAGCSPDAIGSPEAVGVNRTLHQQAAASGHLVYFNSSAPADFGERVAALGGSVTTSYDGVGIAVVDGLSDAAAASLAGTQGVSSVDPNQSYQFIRYDETPSAEATDAVIASPTAPATAFFFPRQWHLRQINADDAWAAGHLGSPSVRVAILDTGIDYLHPDLSGLVDLSRSASFVPSDDALVATFFPTRHPVTDLHYHGTHVAATVSSNAIAAAGVTSRTTLMGVKVLNVNGSGSTAGILGGIMFATDNGANVINMSLGVPSLLPDQDFHWFRKMTDRAFQYAHSRGVAVIVAAGNEQFDLDTKHVFKAYCESVHVTCVSATGPTSRASVNGPWFNIDNPASYTNYGVKAISVAAPGGNGSSTVTAACSSSSLQLPICQTGLFVVGLNGTSMASPHTAGVAALVLAQRGPLNPGTLRSIIEQGVDDLGPKGKDEFYGRGRVNATRALGIE